MKKIIGALLLIVTMFSIGKVSALEYTYSEWSPMYPSGMDPVFIESELRYKWYKFEDNQIIYTDEFYTEYDGYMKDNASETTFYRYITSDYILLNKSNEIVYDEGYCRKNFCYSKLFVEPSMVDMSEKTENKYENADIYEYTSEVAPMTGDTIIYSLIGVVVSLVLIICYVIKKKKNMSYE